MEARLSDNPGESAQRLHAAFMRFSKRHWMLHADLDLRPQEFALLFCVRRMTEEDKGPRSSDLSERLCVRPSTVTPQVDRLVRRGFLQRSPDPNDRRSVRVRLSPEGSRMIEEHRAEFLASFQYLAERLGEERSRELADLLVETADRVQPRNGQGDGQGDGRP